MFDESLRKLRSSINNFLPINNEEWELLAPHVYERHLSKRDCVANEGKVAKEIGFVVEGTMRHYYTKDGEERTTYFYFENHFVASYISCINQQPSHLTIEALTACKLLVFPYAILKELYQKSHTWERFGRLIAEYLAIGLEERMTGLLLLSPEERYYELLQSNKAKIIERIPQHYVASYLGITPVSLSRIRNRVSK